MANLRGKNIIVAAGKHGNLVAQVCQVQQGSRDTLELWWFDRDGNAFDLTGATITAAWTDGTDTYAVDGVLTPDADQTTNKGLFAWALGEGDTGTAGSHSLQFKAVIGGLPFYSYSALYEVLDSLDADAVAAGALVGISASQAAWVATGAAGGPMGTAAYENIGDLPFDDEGAAAAVAGDLATHTGLTGTAVHGLGSASTLTAGATGSSLVQAATVDAARAVLGLAPIPLEPRRLDHSALTYSNALTGSGTAGTAFNVFLIMSSGPTANSTARRYVNSTRLLLGATSNTSINWAVKNIFRCRFLLATPNAEGIFRWMVGKLNWSSYGIGDAEYMVGFELSNGTLTYALYGNNAAATQLGVSGTGNNITIISENGAVSWYADGVLVAQIGSGGPTGDRAGTINYEIQNGATAAAYRVDIWSQSECL